MRGCRSSPSGGNATCPGRVLLRCCYPTAVACCSREATAPTGSHTVRTGRVSDTTSEVLPIFAALARDASVVVDAGANIGLYSLLAARANPAARVFAFEPAGDVFAVLRRNVALNGGLGTVCVRAALGAAPGCTAIFTPAGKVDTVGSAQFGHRVRWMDGPWQCEYAPVVALDDFVASHAIPALDLLKIDVEGAEQLVLAGARTVIGRDRPHVLCELLETRAGAEGAALLREVLLPLGYHAYVLTAAGPAARDLIEPGPDWNHLLSPLRPHELAELLGRPVV